MDYSDDGWWHQQDLELMRLEQAAKQVFAIYLYLLLAQNNFPFLEVTHEAF